MKYIYENLERLLILAENTCPPDQYQARQNALIRATARLVINEQSYNRDHSLNQRDQDEEDSYVDKQEVLHALGDILGHPLFDMLRMEISLSQHERGLIDIMTNTKDLKIKLSQLWNIVNTGNPKGSW